MCDCLVAVGMETADGTTLFGKNSDRPERECQPFVQLTAAAHAPGSMLRCTHVEIPQVPETYAVMGHSPWWVWGFEHGVNEHAVAIGNETVFSKEPIEETPGLIGMDLVRLGLERGRNAREALEVMAALLERHGQGGPAFAPDGAGYHNGFLVADPHEAWVLQTSNRRWAARRVRRDAISNHLSLGRDWEIGSKDLEGFARSRGWWSSEGRIDFAAAYRNPGVPGRISEGRLARSRALLARARRLPRPELEAILRDHGPGGPVRLPGSTPDDEAYYTLCMHSEPVGTTTASLVAPLSRTPEAAPWPVWISFATPCTGIFLPVYLHGLIPAELARGGAAPDERSAWWVLKTLQDAAAADFPGTTPRLREAWKEVETRVEAERTDAEGRAGAALRAGDPDAAEAILTEFMTRTWQGALARARELTGTIVA